MKKIFGLLVVLAMTFALVGCVSGTVLEDTEHDYYGVGAFNSWTASDATYQMEAIARNDDRVASIVDATKGATALYLVEITLSSDDAGWTVSYTIDGTDYTLNGNLTVKVIRTAAGDEVPDWWGQSPESGAISNLTPDTLYIPPFVEENVDNAGGWNDNPVAYEAGSYYLVFAQFDGSKGMALIAVE